MGDIVSCIILLALLLLSGFFSSAETALTTVNKIRMRTLAEDGNRRARHVLRITEDSGRMLSAILIGNNVVNLSASSLATTLAVRLFGSIGAGIATGILTLLILIFGEITPKTKATYHAEQIAMRYAIIIEFLIKVLTPLIFVINKLSGVVLFLTGTDPRKEASALTEEELRTIVDVSQETGVIEDEERDMIHNLFDFGDSEAKEVMVPRIDMTLVQKDASYQEIIEIYRKDRFTRLPVYDDTTDHVIGIINMKDLLTCEDAENFSIQQILREPYFTYEHKNTADLFLEMRKNSISIAIVLDEYGTTAGLITLEDLLEEIVGEIRDEYDADEIDAISRLNEREFMILGSANLDDVSNELDVNFTSENYDTIGGFCLDHLDHLPEKNEIILTDDNILLRIDQVKRNRIERVYIKLPEKREPEEN